MINFPYPPGFSTSHIVHNSKDLYLHQETLIINLTIGSHHSTYKMIYTQFGHKTLHATKKSCMHTN